MMSRNANAYGAMDSPSMLTARLIRSAMPFGLRAASVATMIASTTETTSAYSSSPRVVGTWRASSWLTLWPSMDVPRFPCSTLTSQFQYRCEERLVQAECVVERGHRARARMEPEYRLGGVVGQRAHDRERQEGDADEHRDGGEQPPSHHAQGR